MYKLKLYFLVVAFVVLLMGPPGKAFAQQFGPYKVTIVDQYGYPVSKARITIKTSEGKVISMLAFNGNLEGGLPIGQTTFHVWHDSQTVVIGQELTEVHFSITQPLPDDDYWLKSEPGGVTAEGQEFVLFLLRDFYNPDGWNCQLIVQQGGQESTTDQCSSSPFESHMKVTLTTGKWLVYVIATQKESGDTVILEQELSISVESLFLPHLSK